MGPSRKSAGKSGSPPPSVGAGATTYPVFTVSPNRGPIAPTAQLHLAVTRQRVPSGRSPVFWREVYPPCLGKFNYSTLPAPRLPSSSWAQQLKPLRRRPKAQAPEEAYDIPCNAATHADAVDEIIRRGLADNAADTLIREGEDG